MANTTAMTTQAKVDFLAGVHVIGTDVFKVALVTSTGTYGAASTTFSGTNEIANGLGYVTNGATATLVTPTSDSTTGLFDINDTTWASATFTNVDAAILYNSSKSNKILAVFVLPGAPLAGAGGNFTLVWPAPVAATAPFRIA